MDTQGDVIAVQKEGKKKNHATSSKRWWDGTASVYFPRLIVWSQTTATLEWLLNSIDAYLPLVSALKPPKIKCRHNLQQDNELKLLVKQHGIGMVVQQVALSESPGPILSWVTSLWGFSGFVSFLPLPRNMSVGGLVLEVILWVWMCFCLAPSWTWMFMLIFSVPYGSLKGNIVLKKPSIFYLILDR